MCVFECVSTLQKQLTIFLLQLNIQIIDCSPIWSRSLSFLISFADSITSSYILRLSVSVYECVCLQFSFCVFINKLHYIYRIYIYINIYSMHSLCFSKLSSSTLLPFLLLLLFFIQRLKSKIRFLNLQHSVGCCGWSNGTQAIVHRVNHRG